LVLYKISFLREYFMKYWNFLCELYRKSWELEICLQTSSWDCFSDLVCNRMDPLTECFESWEKCCISWTGWPVASFHMLV
jgi:hypothetical protein